MSSLKRISQATFDSAVLENMQEFDMSKSEAVEDAIDQFRSQGVDLTGVDTSGDRISEDGTVEVRVPFVQRRFV